jgi:1-acyl-sn-glycerol-3-phosphate acyltransferase
MKIIRANILGFLFYLTVAMGTLIVVPPWFLYCVIFGKRQKFTFVAKPFFIVVFFLFGIKVKIEGTLPKQSETCFILCNHQSFLDVPIILCKVSHCAFMAKKSLFKIPYFGQFLTYTGSVPVERGKPQANVNLPNQIRHRLSQNFPIMAFPEGTRSENGELLPFKNGLFRIIKDAGAPVFPVTLVGAYKVMPKKGIALYPGEIKIIPHKIISTEEIAKLPYEELKGLVKNEISLTFC